MKVIGVTLGDPLGIGPEITLKAILNTSFSNAKFILYGSKAAADDYFQNHLANSPSARDFKDRLLQIEWRPTDEEFTLKELSKSPQARAKVTLRAMDQAILDASEFRTSALVTGPIDKSIIRTVLPDFTGHTHYLAEKTRTSRSVMMLDNAEIRVALLTEHIALSDVAQSLNKDLVLEVVEISVSSLKKFFGLSHPKIAITGVNPHAGELQKNSEEERILKPAILELCRKGYRVEGPFPADSFFPIARTQSFDLIVSPYHDQGLVAVKYGGLDRVCNITLGLPFLRTSPGHGVAYDIANQNIAKPESMIRAIQIALKGELHDKCN